MSAHEQIQILRKGISDSIIGQQNVVERLIIGLLANGNLLIEGLPGLAKTRAVKAMSNCLDSEFSRIQFTPDLLPSDVTGTEVYYQQDNNSEFKFEPGPLFANIVLADEINRAPAKVQAALLEAMEERQVTVAGTTHKMPDLFTVIATQNPVEQEGTYPLPEAQMDRFLMKVLVEYPQVEDEVQIIQLVRNEKSAIKSPKKEDIQQLSISQQAIFDARSEIDVMQSSPAMDRYLADLVNATRHPQAIDQDLARWIKVGASPRATLALDASSRAHAWLAGRDYVDPQDVRAIAADVLRHRIALSYEAQGDGKTADEVITRILELVALR